MKTIPVNEKFIEAIRAKIPKYSELANKLTDILLIEKDMVYRRLRGEVAFTLQEASLISEKLGISIDNMGGAINEKSRPFYIKLTDYVEPEDIDYFMMEEYNNFLREIIVDPSAEFFTAAKIIPDMLHLPYKNLTKFYLFKWFYLYGATKKFHEVKAYDQVLEKLDVMMNLYSQVKNLHFVFDKMLFQNLVDDLIYFKDIQLITPDEIHQLEKELLLLVGDLEEIADKGANPLGSRVELYVSNISFDGDCSYLYAQQYKLTLVRSFTLYNITSLDTVIFEEIKKWLHSLKRSSTMISECNLLARNKFFNTQRRIIQGLTT